ncbi:hypothetical protein [Lysobacter claricitrinus]|uniref:hypothetical protein n=1 Tax=Lysobacter claricitrinus TaxID=3367728 RepID=UPI0037DB1B63
MTFKMKLLDLALIGILYTGAAPMAAAQAADTASMSVANAPAIVPAGRSVATLPNGSVVWAIEDPTLTAPRLSVMSAPTAAFDNGHVVGPLRFQGATNYAAFVERIEVSVYRANDDDLVTPLATIALAPGATVQGEWDGALPSNVVLHAGDSLRYVTRAYGRDGGVDETYPQLIQLVTRDEYARGVQSVRAQVERSRGALDSGDAAQSLQLQAATSADNGLRSQTIAIHGSRVRLFGRDVPRGAALSINGQPFPVAQDGTFVAEFLEPVGTHRYALSTGANDVAAPSAPLTVDVTGRYLFLVALADVTLSKSGGNDHIEPLAGDEKFDDGFIKDGRLAFYLKGKVKGKYLVTAQADTQERELDHLFDGFLDATPTDVFRRLDPDAYYPVYGDDSTTTRDVDTQGKLYVRVDWDRSQALWGNFSTGFTGTEYGQYQRSLYGAALNYVSRGSTPLGEPRTTLRAFGSEAQSAPGHSEFLGTGGSLYYLRHTDLLPGSDHVVLEVRDARTGLTEARVDLQRGADYDIDELQGRIILERPLAQITRENVHTLTRDMPLDGLEQVLLADYEYIPAGFDAGHASTGVRAKQWMGDHLAIGGTYVDENRDGDDYRLLGGDLTLQAGRGTYLKLEQHRSDSTAAPVFYSDNGGLGFVVRNPVAAERSGTASAVDARANLKELGWTARDWSVGAWWRDVDAGFSVARFDTASPTTEAGAEFSGQVGERFDLFGRVSRVERGASTLEDAQLTGTWRPTDVDQLGMELRRVREQGAGADQKALLAALEYRRRVGSSLELYGSGQASFGEDGGYASNNRVTAGAKYLFGNGSNVGAELSDGSRGHAAQVNGEYRLGDDHSVYGAYTYSTDTTASRVASEFDRVLANGWTLGQRWRVSNRVNVYNESQGIRSANGDDGVSHTLGMDLYPADGWQLGFTVMDGALDASTGHVDRNAYSVSAGHTDLRTQWSSKLEYRRDSGAEQRTQWVTTNRLLYRVNEDWRIAARVNYADTDDALNAAAGARLAESNLGFAWRPHDTTRYAMFGKYTYLLDLATLGQDGGAQYDQRSQVVSLEGVVQLGDRWSLAPKLASRWGDYRMGRGVGQWLDSRADFSAMQLRYHLPKNWDALAELRRLDVRDGGTRHGGLIGVDRQLGDNFKIGVGYNFTDFSDDLTDLEYDHHGVFLNLAGFY